MSLKILFPDEIEELAEALDGISEATAQAAQDGPQSLAAFRLGVRVAMAAMVSVAFIVRFFSRRRREMR